MFTAELFGESYFYSMILAPATLVGTDGSIAPLSTEF